MPSLRDHALVALSPLFDPALERAHRVIVCNHAPTDANAPADAKGDVGRCSFLVAGMYTSQFIRGRKRRL